jgi:chemotaxis protein CheD
MASARMGEMVISSDPNEELVALGLGSCIGLAIVDRTARVAGLAHIVLPESNERSDQVGKFADTAVPALLAKMRNAGAVERRLETAIAGGARMFEVSGGLDIGSRNEAAVRAALAKARITVKAARTGGSAGRTLKISLAKMLVTVRSAGQPPETLLDGRRTRATAGLGAPR